MTYADYAALVFFVALWGIFNWVTDNSRRFDRWSVTRGMAEHRAAWIRNSQRRDLKMIDTQIMAGLQNGTAFFASTSIFALGSCFALLGATDQVEAIFRDLPSIFHSTRNALELKVGGLAVIFAYSFFKFGWSYRLFNYCSIMFGALPMMQDADRDPEATENAVEQVITMNILAAKAFNAGLRAIFLSIGYLGWFVNAYTFMAMTLFIFFVLIRRQFFSDARVAILRGIGRQG